MLTGSPSAAENTMPCYAIDGITPVVHPDAFVHPTAVLIGDVIVGAGCYVAPLASLRGDFGRIVLEAGSNLQDCCVMHGFPSCDTVIGTDGHIGHAAVLHGCRIEDDALVGMNATIMDGVVIGRQSIVAANAFIKAGFEAPARSLIAGVPGKIYLRSMMAPDSSSTTALTCSPNSSSGIPKTATSDTPGCSPSTRSISAG